MIVDMRGEAGDALNPLLDFEVGEFDAVEDPDPLFDSKRSYIDQLMRYLRHKGKEIEYVKHPDRLRTRAMAPDSVQ